MAILKIGFNEGSLLRRTLVHVATFVAGSIAFVGVMSLVLVTVARGLVPHQGADGTTGERPGETNSAASKSKTVSAKPTTWKKPANAGDPSKDE